MDMNALLQLRTFVTQRLKMHGDIAPPQDADLLFTTGRLDSLDAVELVLTLETEFEIDFAQMEFDLTLLDSISAISSLVDKWGKVHA